MLVAVGTSNIIKIDAAKEAFGHFYGDVRVVGVSISNLPPQPITLSSTVNGALTRARTALGKFTEAEFGVGIEAGLMEIPDMSMYLNVQFAVIIDGAGKITIGSSPGFQLPNELARMVLIERMEIDKAAELLYGIKDIGEKRGVIDLMTRGAISRKELIRNALIMAIAPRIGESH
jgi:inosine/xanthosine triphosphatase